MKVILLATVVALVSAVAAAYVLDTRFQRNVVEVFSTDGVRL